VANDWRRTARLIGLVVSGWRARAFDYLEAHGQRFCVDFGTDNAIEKARQHWAARKKRKRVSR
jgi:hypothetical protein